MNIACQNSKAERIFYGLDMGHTTLNPIEQGGYFMYDLL
jgi:hypothetical protein